VLYELVLVAVHMENETSDVQRKYQEPLQLISPVILMTSTIKQMRPNGRGAREGEWRGKGQGCSIQVLRG